MLLKFADYKNKLMGCWLGKNIGGILGAPFEGKRQINNVEFYIQDMKGNPPANDDLDLQLVFLNAVERFGSNVNASILGEYWLSFITPDWVEYGAGKNNLRMGLVPPLSGYIGNPYKDSCGCFIRSELWACLAPGNPEIAVRYAYEDAIVDHSEEGLYGEVFCAAVQSAAFVENDRYRLIDIGLSYIPEQCGVARGIRAAIASYKAGVSFIEARKNVLTEVPGFFGAQFTPLKNLAEDVPNGNPGWDAPSNIGIMVIGWLYGENDFGRSLCIAVNCGEDADCSAATLGATLGIILGADGIPEKWIEPIGDKINTACVSFINGTITIPGTVTELTQRILKAAPLFLGSKICDILACEDRYTIKMVDAQELYSRKDDIFGVGAPPCNVGDWKPHEPQFGNVLKRAPYAVGYKFLTFNAVFDYLNEPYIKVNETKKFRLTLMDNNLLGQQQWLNLKWYLPEGIKIIQGRETSVFLPYLHATKAELEFDILVESLNGNKVELLLDITSNGRHTRGTIPVVLIARG